MSIRTDGSLKVEIEKALAFYRIRRVKIQRRVEEILQSEHLQSGGHCEISEIKVVKNAAHNPKNILSPNAINFCNSVFQNFLYSDVLRNRIIQFEKITWMDREGAGRL